ncbi:putative inorganic phosphate cotransporter [Onthophagus taurus]|uniref:putative inorganic phosphate cotransporter n=1 Tax=Onthophagus taurus TaxID=166361 RepID=UPI000C209430|nr:putative inorganic phosphate cotransporter [Onthophagus taurus]
MVVNTEVLTKSSQKFVLKSWFGVRHKQLLLLFFLLVIGYGMRINLSIGIVAMTDPTINPNFPTYNWTMDTKSTLLSSFFWGYVVPQIGAGQLAEKFGAKWILTIAMTISSIFTFLIPTFANFSTWGVMVCRISQGFTQGFFFPCVHNMLSKWIPLRERSRMGTFVYAGGPLGTVISMPLTGWISASTIGWPGAFYLYGCFGLIWVLMWIWRAGNNPEEYKTITDEEKLYILKGSGQQNQTKAITPWKKIVTSLPIIAILVANSGQMWSYWTLMTEIPTYMKGVLQFDIEKNGLLSAAPYFALWVLSFPFGYITDFSINKKIFSVGVVRKIITTVGMIGPAISLFILGILKNPSPAVAVTLLIAAVGLNSAIFCGFQVNHMDIAPTYAGTTMGFTNGFGNIFAIVAPLVVELIVKDESDESQWNTVFFIAGGIYVVVNIFYVIFGSGKRQNWDCQNNQSGISKNVES